MTHGEFYEEIKGYYGDFSNETVTRHFLRILKKIPEADLEKLLDWFLENIPSTFHADAKALLDGTKACFIRFIETKKTCPICNAKNDEESNFCWHCGYDFSVPAEECRKLLAKPEDVSRAFSKLYRGLAEKKAEIRKLQEVEK